MPVIAWVRGKYIISGGTDSTHLTLMAPASNGAEQSFTLVVATEVYRRALKSDRE